MVSVLPRNTRASAGCFSARACAVNFASGKTPPGRARVFMPEGVFELQQDASIGAGQEQSTIAGAPMESSMMLGPFQVRAPCSACRRRASLALAMRDRGEDYAFSSARVLRCLLTGSDGGVSVIYSWSSDTVTGSRTPYDISYSSASFAHVYYLRVRFGRQSV